jgi:hypothetical protein
MREVGMVRVNLSGTGKKTWFSLDRDENEAWLYTQQSFERSDRS